MDRLAARRAATRRDDGADRAARAGGLGARALRVPAQHAGGRAAAGRPLPHPASGGAPGRSRRRAARARARRRALGGGAALGLALFGRLLGRPRRGIRARADLRVLLPRRASAAGGARLHRGARYRLVPALGQRRAGQPLRGRHRPLVRVRGVAERPLPPSSALSRARRGRGGPVRVGRGGAARGRRAARRVQLPLRPALAERAPRSRQPVPVHRRRAGGSADRPAGGAAPPPRRTGHPAAHLHDQHRRRVLARRRLAGAHRRDGQAGRDAATVRAAVPLRGHPAYARGHPAAGRRSQHRGPRAPHLQRGGLLAAAPRGAGQPGPVGDRRRRAAAERSAAPGRFHRGRSREHARGVHGDPRRALPRSSVAAAASRFRLRGGARHRDLAAEDRRALRHGRPRGGRRRQRAPGHPPLRAAGAAGHVHRVEPAASRSGRPGRSHGHDGIDAAVRAHRGGARPRRRPAPRDRRALRGPRRLPRARAERRAGHGGGAPPAGGGRLRGVVGGRRPRGPALPALPAPPTPAPSSPRRRPIDLPPAVAALCAAFGPAS